MAIEYHNPVNSVVLVTIMICAMLIFMSVCMECKLSNTKNNMCQPVSEETVESSLISSIV